MRFRIVPVILTALLLFSLALPGSAAEAATFEVSLSSEEVSAGDTFDVTVSLRNNPGFYAIQFALGFDNSSLQCSRISYGPLMENVLAVKNPSSESGAIVAGATSDGVFEDGSIAVFHFQAIIDHPSMAFSLEDMVFSDINGKAIPFEKLLPSGKEPSVDMDTETDQAGWKDETGSGNNTGSGGNESDSFNDNVSGVPSGTEDNESSDNGHGSAAGNAADTATQDIEEYSSETDASSVAETIIFPDIQNHWGREAIVKATKLGLFRGYDDGRFGPNDPVTRVQLVTLLYRLSGSPDVEEVNPFTDIAGEIPEFRKAISWAYANGYVNGRTETTFDPRTGISRQETMTILFRFSGGVSGLETMFTSIYDESYSDSDQIASWAKKAVYWGVYKELIRGTSEVTIDPKGITTRAQMATLLVNYIEKFMN